MSWFRPKPRHSVNNTAASGLLAPSADYVPPQPQELVVHHHPPAPWKEYLVIFGIAVTGLVLLWQALVFLAGEAGYPNPSRAVVQGLMILGGLGLLFLFSFLLVNLILSKLWDHNERMEQLHLESLERRLYQAQAVPPAAAATMTDEDKRKYKTVIAVMGNGYASVDLKGRLRSRSQPWSKRQAGKLILRGETKAIGEDSDLAKWVAPYLLEKGILVDDRTIDIVRFPGLPEVEALLVAEFGRQIMMTSGQAVNMSNQYTIRGAPGQSTLT